MLASDYFSYFQLHFRKIVYRYHDFSFFFLFIVGFRFGFRRLFGGVALRVHRFHFRKNFRLVETGKKFIVGVIDLGAVPEKPEFTEIGKISRFRSEYPVNLLRRFGHHAFEYARADDYGFGKIVKHRFETFALRLVLRKRPWHRFVYVFVGSAEHVENIRHGVGNAVAFHFFRDFGVKRNGSLLELVVHGFVRLAVGNHAVEILFAHRYRSAYEVAVHVGEFSVDRFGHEIPADQSVVIERHLGEKIISYRVHAVESDEIGGVDNVPFRLGHLAAVLQKPRMTEHLLRERLAHRHEEYRPVNGMESHDILTYDVHVGGPILFVKHIGIAFGAVAEPRHIVAQSVHPYVNDVLGIEFHRNSPFERCTRHAQILKSRLEEIIQHFVFTRNGYDKVRILLVILYKPVRIFAHTEEIRFFLRHFDFSAAIGTFTVHELRLRPERFTGSAVPALIRAFVNVALLIKFREYFLYLAFVVGVGGTDELIVRNIHHIPDLADITRDFVDESFGRYARGSRFLLDLFAVFVRSRLESHVVTLLTLETGKKIGKHYFVNVADMRGTRRICYGGGYIIFRFLHYAPLTSVAR